MAYIPEFAIIAQFALATLIIAITPGPDMTLFVGRTLSQGRAAGLACMAGAMSGILVHTLLVSLGLSALIVASPQAFLALKIFGAGYLIWLAVQAIRRGAAFSPEKAAGPRRSLAGNWAMGIAINLLNPKIVLFFMTFLPQFVSATDPYAPQKLLFLGLLFIPISLPVTVPMVLAADSFASMLKRMPRVMRVVDYLFAGIFSAFALRILTASAR
ncbi:LysE family translocator [Neoaquamicrobium sediminum]|jgi:threonine/homoserine/homoserine lactone efflux protein|uniref:LysE family translocator n=1 Tax=Neoaquamicrobium sediminum TaxID=1849104 RepID=UPI0015648934|nr:LysE family translocator [Mesorhizobium sediminum]NRC53985.1 LysE family translocator [Mesorhizobium sediminum]